MRRFLFHLQRLLLCGIGIACINNTIVAEENPNVDKSANSDKGINSDKTKEEGQNTNKKNVELDKKYIHTTVDSLLKINKETGSAARVEELEKEVSKLKAKIEEMEKQKSNSATDKNEPSAKNEKKTDQPEKPASKAVHSRGSKLRRRRSSGVFSNRIRTVKNRNISPLTTNKYIIGSQSRIKSFGGRSATQPRKIEYVIKSYGKQAETSDESTSSGEHEDNTHAEVTGPSKNSTIKSKKYFKNRNECASGGCS